MTTSSRAALLAEEVARLLNDAEHGYAYTRWSQDELIEYANDGVAQIAMLRPDIVAREETITLQPGARQVVPEGATFFRVEGTLDRYGRRIGQPSKTDGQAARVAQTWFAVLACPRPGDYVVLSFAFDDAQPNVFYVEPPVPPGKEVKAVISMARVPDPFGANDAVPLDRRFHNALIEWMLYRAFSKDQDSAPDAGLSASHKQHFYEMLGLSQQADDRYFKKSAGEAARVAR
ncbi:DUF6682 family protein [Dyella sp.]|uniref:phage adaptor protein n=1 Tax=Dyella sp. TaxID=1869338 RepID=UPI002FDAC5DA